MRKILVTFILFTCSLAAVGKPPTEAEMVAASKKYDDLGRKRVVEIFDAWLADGSAESKVLATRYLSPDSSVNSSLRASMIEKVVERNAVELFPLALGIARSSFQAKPVQDKIVGAVAARLGSNPNLAAAIRS